jgi:RHS repeat-associated protein
LWEGNTLSGEYSQGEFSWYIYEPNSNKPLALVRKGQLYYYQLDQLGTPLSLTDSENNLVWHAHYSVFGKATVIVNKVDNPIRFQGQYFDSESGLHYNHFRYYDPETGRFISQDPIGLLGGINHYQYAPNHINWIDPLGLKCKESQRISNARSRQRQMLVDNVGFNVSPIEWDAFPAIGRLGTFVSDLESITSVLGDINGFSQMTVDKSQAANLENAFGLEPDTLQEGFKIRQVNNIVARNPRSPMEGNRFFLGPGKHLPGGAPEMVVESIPTIDGGDVTTLTEVKVI